MSKTETPHPIVERRIERVVAGLIPQDLMDSRLYCDDCGGSESDFTISAATEPYEEVLSITPSKNAEKFRKISL